jgi:adenylate kinase family enzyme
MATDNSLVYLFGYPGVGKNTIAREIENASSHIALQNHLISNAFRHLMSKQDKSGYPRIESLVKHHTMKAWLNVLDFIDAAIPDQGLVFTSVLYDDPDRIEYFDYIRNWAQQRGRKFYPVRLNCSPEEVIRRAQSPSRDSEFKLTDADTLQNIMATNDLLIPPDKTFLDLDITNLPATTAAQKILAHIA